MKAIHSFLNHAAHLRSFDEHACHTANFFFGGQEKNYITIKSHYITINSHYIFTGSTTTVAQSQEPLNHNQEPPPNGHDPLHQGQEPLNLIEDYSCFFQDQDPWPGGRNVTILWTHVYYEQDLQVDSPLQI